ncbi:hypothetical protein IFR05_015975 [Cadophora sp. M221]|nr:hypothetical protein IFR05_015975 [Cadophora sp. M221]
MEQATLDTLEPTEKLRGYHLMLGVDFERIIDNRSKTSVPWDKSFIWRLGLEKRENGEILPFIFIEMPCMTRRPSEAISSPISLKSTRPWLDDCWTKASMKNEVLLQKRSLGDGDSEWMIKEPCKIFVANKQGLRVHLLPLDQRRQCSDGCTPQQDASLRLLKFLEDRGSWRDIYGRSKDACQHIRERVKNLKPLASNKWCDALWTVTTPGTINRKGRLPSPVKPLRTYGNGNNLEMREAAAFVGREFIQLGLQEFAEDATVEDDSNFRSSAKENSPAIPSSTEMV